MTIKNLNTNPCKMCMPMGACIAFRGLEKSITILHGSQGCSTYIRRHMATHYNEPIDIASSSLTEEGTVYGGEANLKTGLKNVIKLYQPQVIGIATTCLADTIGEDIKRIVEEFKEEENLKDISLIPVHTPGYGGSQFEGYYLTIRRMLESITEKADSDGKINIIAGNLTPADIRAIKGMIEAFGLKYTILPDISENLDRPFLKEYSKLPEEGTTIKEIREMSGATATIEMGVLAGDDISPGKYLEEKYGVPLYRSPLPIGLENTDVFIELLTNLSKNLPPSVLNRQRGRMLDGMIDSHKYNAEGRAAIFGDPEIVLATSQLCLENGIKPVLLATGSKASKLHNYMNTVNLILDDTDFDNIRSYTKELGVNILIGNSDGNYITEKEGIPLVRIGFPIHDRIGAQRQLNVGYQGSMSFLDKITNTLLEHKHNNYRENMYQKYYKTSF